MERKLTFEIYIDKIKITAMEHEMQESNSLLLLYIIFCMHYL
jgi:hypothetical protein